MGKFRNYILLLILLAFTAAIIGSRAKAWSEPEHGKSPISITLAEISNNIKLMKNEKVRFHCRFATSGNMFRENDAIFTAEKFENFSVWEDKIKFWNNSEIKTVYPTLYVAREKEELIKKIRILQRFCELEITGIIENDYANMPWISVEEIKVKNNDELDQTMVSHIRRAGKFIASNEFQKARICFELAMERKTPDYVKNYIQSQKTIIAELTQQHQIDMEKQFAENFLSTARINAQDKKYKKAATAYGKALQASKEYNESAAIHKEIAGFFIDFYKAEKDEKLLDYSIKEFNIAAELSGGKDSDILYALAYIENIKASKTHNYKKAEKLARECIALNSLHYGGRKLLTDIISAQLSTKNNIIRKPIKIAAKTQNDNEIDLLLNSDDLFAMDEEIDNISNTLNRTNEKMISIKKVLELKDKTEETLVEGITAADFQGLLAEEDIISDDQSEFDKAENDLINTVLPDFPISPTPMNSKLPALAL